MNRQFVFDTIVNHAFSQQKCAVNSFGKCRYRTDNGLKCFIGALIPDSMYDKEMEGRGVLDIAQNYPEFCDYWQIGESDLLLLADLQMLHDMKIKRDANRNFDLQNMYKRFSECATIYSLNTKTLESYKRLVG